MLQNVWILNSLTVAFGTKRALVMRVTGKPLLSLTVSLITPNPSTRVLPETPIKEVAPLSFSKDMKSSLNGEMVTEAPVSNTMGASPSSFT